MSKETKTQSRQPTGVELFWAIGLLALAYYYFGSVELDNKSSLATQTIESLFGIPHRMSVGLRVRFGLLCFLNAGLAVVSLLQQLRRRAILSLWFSAVAWAANGSLAGSQASMNVTVPFAGAFIAGSITGLSAFGTLKIVLFALWLGLVIGSLAALGWVGLVLAMSVSGVIVWLRVQQRQRERDRERSRFI